MMEIHIDKGVFIELTSLHEARDKVNCSREWQMIATMSSESRESRESMLIQFCAQNKPISFAMGEELIFLSRPEPKKN